MATAAAMAGKLLVSLLFLGLGFNPRALAKAVEPVVIAVLDTGVHSPHQAQVVAALQTLLKNCKPCEVKTFPIYDKDGNLSDKTFLPALKNAASKSQIIHLSWNTVSTPEMKNLESELSRVAKDHVVIAAAGRPENEIAAPLAKTVMGRVSQALIVGEASPQGHLVSNSYYGPEMLTALSVPDGSPSGSSFSALKLTAAVARWIAKHRPKELSQIFNNLQQAKKKSFSNEPSLSELGLD